MSAIDEQLIDLQTRMAYQEDTLNQLNDVIARQDAEIVQFKQQLRLMAQQLDELASNPGREEGEVADERPPHY